MAYLLKLSGPSWVCHDEEALDEYMREARAGEAEEPVLILYRDDDDEDVVWACEQGNCSGGCGRR